MLPPFKINLSEQAIALLRESYQRHLQAGIRMIVLDANGNKPAEVEVKTDWRQEGF